MYHFSMYFWNKYKFLIIFGILVVATPFFVTNMSKTLFQEAQTISTNTSPCLDVNPPTVWVEKDINSRKGYAPSGVKNTELVSLNLVTCGDVEIEELRFVLEFSGVESFASDLDFMLNILGQDFKTSKIDILSKNKLSLIFKFEESIKISVVESKQDLTVYGTFPGEHSGKTKITLTEILLADLANSKVLIGDVESSLIFVKKEL